MENIDDIDKGLERLVLKKCGECLFIEKYFWF